MQPRLLSQSYYYNSNISKSHSQQLIPTLATFFKIAKCQYLFVPYLLFPCPSVLCFLVKCFPIPYLLIYIHLFYPFCNVDTDTIFLAQSSIFPNDVFWYQTNIPLHRTQLLGYRVSIVDTRSCLFYWWHLQNRYHS